MTQEDIDNKVRKATDSSIQALTMLVREIQKKNDEHREEEKESRVAYRDQMLSAVEKKIDTKVNGKIDMLIQEQRKRDVTFDEHIKRVEPVLKAFEDNKVLAAGVKRWGGWILAGAGSIVTISAGWYIFKQWIINLKM